MDAARIIVQQEDFDIEAEVARMTDGQPDVGAVVTFTGVCRHEHGKLAALELEHFAGMAESEIRRIAEEAARRWPLTGVTVIHRYGRMRPGDRIVLVVTASEHRHAAFEAAGFLMDYLKSRAPFWKKEHLRDGSVGAWVVARAEDELAAERWQDNGGSTAMRR
jgi:molybdopterin synthase catalytic subunit